MTRASVRSVAVALLMTVSAILVSAQSSPTPFNLSGGTYSFTQWDATNAAGTYPANMTFHTYTKSTSTPDVTMADAPTGTWSCVYNSTSGPRIAGKGAAGFSFITSGGTPTCTGMWVGAAVLALNTQNRANVTVNWTAGTVATLGRTYSLRFQYRIGTGGTWTDVLQNGLPTEYLVGAIGTTQSFSTLLPIAAENQPVVEVRWVYNYISGSGSRPEMSLDEISATSTSSIGTPTKFSITAISPSSPSTSSPFSVTVRSTDALGNPMFVATATSFTLSRVTGTGTLSGVLTGTIPAGASSVTLTNVNYNVAEAGVVIRATRTAGDALAFGDSNPFTIQQGASQLRPTNFQNVGWANSPFPAFTVDAIRPDGTIDATYSGPITFTKVSGPGNVTLTSSVVPFQGTSTFDDVSVDLPGTYVFQVSGPNVASNTLATVTVWATPTLTTTIVPQYVHGRDGAGSSANLPNFALVTFSNLQPNTLYRFNTGLATDQILTSTGGGFNIHYTNDANTYSYNTSKSTSTDGAYSTFTTAPGQTTKTLWINLTTSTNVAFQELQTVYWRISLTDNIGRLVTRYQLAQTSTTLQLGPETTRGTGIADIQSQLTPKNIVCLYDVETPTVSTRPISTAIVQDDGTTLTGAYSWYAALDGSPTSWATFIPNTLPNGVRRIEERDWRTGAIVYFRTSTNGVWNGVNTVGATGGSTSPIYLQTPRITIATPVLNDTLCGLNSQRINFTARGTNNVLIEFSSNNGVNWIQVATVPAASGSFNWTVLPIDYSNNCLIRITGVERTDISATSGRFTIATKPAVVQQPVSSNLCLGQDYVLVTLTSGSVRRMQWMKDGRDISGANSPILSIKNAGWDASGSYTCRIETYGTCGTIFSNEATIRVARPIQVVDQPRVVNVTIGQRAEIAITVENPNDATFQWRRGTNPISDNGNITGTNSSTLTINNVTAADVAADYNCVVVGVCGTVTTKDIRLLTIGVYADIPQSTVNACIGQNAVIQGQVYSNPAGVPLDVQWTLNGSVIMDGDKYEGTNTGVLKIKNMLPADQGTYILMASFAGDESSMSHDTVVVSLASAPTISAQPAATSVCPGTTLTMNVSAVGAGTITYQWYANNTAIAGQTSATLSIPDFTEARQGIYYCVVSTACGTAQSNPASVTAKARTAFTQQPAATLEVKTNETLTLTVLGAGEGTVQYQWFKDGTALNGEVAPVYTKANATASDAGKYWVRLRAECGDQISDTSTVTVAPVVSSVNEDVMAGGAIVERVVPNPAFSSASFNVNVPAPSRVSIVLTNTAGMVVETLANGVVLEGAVHFDIDASTLATGTYLLVTSIGTDRHVQQLVIIK
ncbi:MAG: immunoglobulin domain-containing protein [Bacteroidetes bacterium]|nr:immunoglobulin domain-containing protein [Bacteroidota bacterium]